MLKPLIADGEYPCLKNLPKDAYSARIISAAYATSSGELNAVLQYVYHAVNFSFFGDEARAQTLNGIAVAEMLHLRLLAEALINLGTQPVFSFNPPWQYNFYSTKFVAYSRSLKNMIEDDIMGERYAIYCYERMLTRLKNDTLKRLVCRILEDEHLHLETLNKLLCGLSCR